MIFRRFHQYRPDGIRLSRKCILILFLSCITVNIVIVCWLLVIKTNDASSETDADSSPLSRFSSPPLNGGNGELVSSALHYEDRKRKAEAPVNMKMVESSSSPQTTSSAAEKGRPQEGFQQQHNAVMGNSSRNAAETIPVLSEIQSPVAVVAHVVSLIKCSKSSATTGFLDSAAVLRHSIHQISWHNNEMEAADRSKYSYKMYAIVMDSCKDLVAPMLQKLGYSVLVKPPLVRLDEIKDGWYKNHVESENCCGSAEFIKLYAYELAEHPIVVHWDMDVAVLQPMDDLFDAMLFDVKSVEGKRARKRLLDQGELQHPDEALPDSIDAFFTRDITSAQPWEKVQGVQGGFLVARPSNRDLQTYMEIIRGGNYARGRGEGSGWNSLGYGGFQGAMAYQGVVAFFYDHHRPNSAVELNVCRWNQVVADVIWRGPARMEHHMQCREYPRNGNFTSNVICEDCRVTPIERVKSVHYTACKKPWECALAHPRNPRDKRQVYRLSHLTNVTTCGLLMKKWYQLRRDMEERLESSIVNVKPSKRDGAYSPEYFMGYCNKKGGYIPMNPPPDAFDMKEIYGI